MRLSFCSKVKVCLCGSAVFDFVAMPSSAADSSSTAVDGTMAEDLAWLEEVEVRHARDRALERDVAEVSTEGNVDFALVVGVSTLDRLPEVVLGEVQLAIGPSSCPICLGDFRAGQRRTSLPCVHLFHSECVRKWLGEGKDECPVCRASVARGVGVSASCGALGRLAPSSSSTATSGEPSQDELRERRLGLRFQAGAEILSRMSIAESSS